MSQNTNFLNNDVKGWQEILKLYEDENKLLKIQLNEICQTNEQEIKALKEKLLEEINQMSQKELNFKIIKQKLEENIAKNQKEIKILEKKLNEQTQTMVKLQKINEENVIKITTLSQENIELKKKNSMLQGNIKVKRKIFVLFKKILYIQGKKELEDLEDKNRELQEKINDFSNKKFLFEGNIQKILEEYNKTIENYGNLTEKIEEKNNTIELHMQEINEIKRLLYEEKTKNDVFLKNIKINLNI